MEFDNSKICRSLSEHLLHQQDNKQFCNCNRNFTINRVCIDLKYYRPISLAFKNEVLTLTLELLLDYGLVHKLVCSDPSQANNFGRKINLGLIQGFKMNKKFADVIIISKALEWISNSSLLLAQHYLSLHHQNMRPTLLSCPLEQPNICVEPLIKQIKHWRARIISRDFEAYPKNMGYFISEDSLHQIFCSKRIDPLPSKSITEDTQLLMEHRSNYILPWFLISPPPMMLIFHQQALSIINTKSNLVSQHVCPQFKKWPTSRYFRRK